MSADTFSVKIVDCDTEKVFSVIIDLEHKWLESILVRLKIPKIMIDKKNSRSLGSMEWREYLFKTFGVTISKDIESEEVNIFKYNSSTDQNIKIGQWSMPEQVRVKEKDGKYHTKLILRYWQII